MSLTVLADALAMSHDDTEAIEVSGTSDAVAGVDLSPALPRVGGGFGADRLLGLEHQVASRDDITEALDLIASALSEADKVENMRSGRARVDRKCSVRLPRDSPGCARRRAVARSAPGDPLEP